MRDGEWTPIDRVVMRWNNLKIRLRNNTIRLLGGYDQNSVGFLVHSAKTLVQDLEHPTVGTIPMVAHLHARRVQDAICRLDPELGRISGFRHAA